MAQVLELIPKNLSVLIHGELSRGNDVGEQACKQQQADHDPEQMRHLKIFLRRFPFVHINAFPLFRFQKINREPYHKFRAFSERLLIQIKLAVVLRIDGFALLSSAKNPIKAFVLLQNIVSKGPL